MTGKNSENNDTVYNIIHEMNDFRKKRDKKKAEIKQIF